MADYPLPQIVREAQNRGVDVNALIDPTTLAPGTRVRLSYPYRYWGEGVVVSNDPGRKWRNPDTNRVVRAKPLEIRRDADGSIGWFHYDALMTLAS